MPSRTEMEIINNEVKLFMNKVLINKLDMKLAGTSGKHYTSFVTLNQFVVYFHFSFYAACNQFAADNDNNYLKCFR
ncbi:CLUMA_CG019875, isoform A [Clunio marinus]|uniref:CLUMA_CG019875, isoform A n=1 Tax=Clunio marinus TaxID=568069 RepID=A0A1J1J3F3_9DIPT|nr:CLUMA_CG019875, isoform A [Clunio marinus]